jgi:hypothetical protein
MPLHDAAPVLPGLRLRNMLSLLVYALSFFAGTVILFTFARRSELHQAFFTYRANIKVFGNANTISPFAIIPTVLAILINLWWETVDSTSRLVQPYVSMFHGPKRPSESTSLSYASCFWLWASLKAVRKRHWLLSLVAMTTFLIQIRKCQAQI